MIKRLFDVTVAAVALLLLIPVFIVVAGGIWLTSGGPILFHQQRVGRQGRPFMIAKFRTMHCDVRGRTITAGADPRITPVGKILRATKFDELPQLINVLLGDMSLVGPRPEVPRYVEMFRDDYREILQVRPGITDMASIKYCDEATILGRAQDPEVEYIRNVLPEKIALAKEYIRRSSFCFDLMLIGRTLFNLVWQRTPEHDTKGTRS